MLTTYKLIQGDSVLVAQPLLIQHYGRVGASLIQQIYYWSQKGQGVIHDNQRWIHNTAEQWAEQLCVSARTIKRTVHKLIEDGAIRVQKLAKHKSNQTNSYTLNHARLQQIMGQAGQGENGANPHRDILSLPTGHDVPMVIQRLTNKNKDNKSEDCVPQHIQTLVKVEGDSTNLRSTIPCNLLQNKEIATPPSMARNDGSVVGEAKKIGTTVLDMIDIWNNEVSLNKKTLTIKLNHEISKYLMASYKYKFNEDLLAWTHYCRLIASSPYLMGEGFNLSLTWALKFGTIDRIMAGELGVKGLRPVHESAKTEEEMVCQALSHIDGVGESEGCKQARKVILKALGPVQYNAWFTQVDITDDGATLKPHNRFVDDAIRARFGDVLGACYVD